MSTLIVPVTTIQKIKPHGNADSLEVAEILGWQVVVGKGSFKEGDRVLYVPPDAVLPVELSDKYGVTKYLSKGRVKQVRLRGEPSFGFAVPIADSGLANSFIDVASEGENVAEELAITKYEPPVKLSMGDGAPDRADFPKYTGIENMRNFPNLLEAGEEVVVTEKIHGTNCRIGIIKGELVAGSHGVVRKPPQTPDGQPLPYSDKMYAANIYWSPFAIEPVRLMLEELAKKHEQVILYGEVFGSRIQSLHYGHTGSLGFRAFDLFIDGKFVDAAEFFGYCGIYQVPTVPIVGSFPYSLEAVKALSDGRTMLGADHIREGVVVRPTKERTHPKLGRVILKYVGDAYLFGDQTDSKDV